MVTTQGAKLLQLVLLKQATHAAVGGVGLLQPSRHSEVESCEQHAVMAAQLELQSRPLPPPLPVLPPVPEAVPHAPLWQLPLHWHVPVLGSVQEPLAVLPLTLPLQLPEPSPKEIEFPFMLP